MLLGNRFHSLFCTAVRFLSCNKSPSLARSEVFHLILEKVSKILDTCAFVYSGPWNSELKAPVLGQFTGWEQQRCPTASATGLLAPRF